MAWKPRVLHLGSFAGLYGAERWILALVKHLDPSIIHSVVGVIKDDKGLEVPLCSKAAKLGFETVVFDAPGMFNPSAVKQLYEYIKNYHIDILHTHYYKTDLIGLLACRKTKCKIISTPHGWTVKADFKLRCYEQLDRILFPFMDAVAPLSNELFDSLCLSKFNIIFHKHSYMSHNFDNSDINQFKNIYLIPNGVDISEIDSVHIVSPMLQRWSDSGTFIIGYIGRLVQGKGLDIMLQSLAYARDSIKFKAALVGDGPLRNELEDMAARLGLQDRVRFYGFQEKRLEFLKGFDVFILPSLSEGIPRCLMEAMAAGVPVVASDIPGCRNLVKHEDTGLLFTSEDSHNLAKAILDLAGNQSKRLKLAARAAEFVREHFSAQRIARDYEKLYLNMVEKR